MLFPLLNGIFEWDDAELSWKEVLCALIEERADLYAFEVSDGEVEKRVAWRRWPAQGTPEFETALGMHEHAVQWANDGG